MSHPRPQTLVLLAALLLAQGTAYSALFSGDTAEEVFPPEPDPFVGDWVGRWSEDEKVDPDIAAQVIALGGKEYQVRLVTRLDMRCPPLAIVDAKSKGGAISFKSDPYYGEIRGDQFTGGRGKQTFEMKKVVRLSPTLGLTPPEGAVVLFDGTSLDPWQPSEKWEILGDGTLMVAPKGKDLVSKQTFTDVKLHIEFRLPFRPKARGQERGNSGVFLQGVYEVQVLDSYGLEGYCNECGALYKVAAPMVNACAPPLQWQTYDITYRAPRHDANGKLAANPLITVLQNGVLIHNGQEMAWITDWKEEDRLKPAPSEPGPIKLQAHSNYVQYRNIWAVDLAVAK